MKYLIPPLFQGSGHESLVGPKLPDVHIGGAAGEPHDEGAGYPTTTTTQWLTLTLLQILSACPSRHCSTSRPGAPCGGQSAGGRIIEGFLGHSVGGMDGRIRDQAGQEINTDD